MRLKFASYTQPINTLSGGNQQKVVLAKWLATNPRLLILDEPTQGIDIQAKSEVHRIISELAAQGLAILLISSDMPELLGMCDTIHVMRQGELVAEFDRENADQYDIALAATGATVPTEPVADAVEAGALGSGSSTPAIWRTKRLRSKPLPQRQCPAEPNARQPRLRARGQGSGVSSPAGNSAWLPRSS